MTHEHLGHAAALACAALWAVSTVLFGAATRTVDVRALNLWKSGLAAVLLSATAIVLGDLPSISARDAVALAISGILGVLIADTAYFTALKHLGAPRAVLFISGVPVCTTLIAVPVLHEPLTPLMGLGMVITLAGVTLVVRSRVPVSTTDALPSPAAVTAGIVAGVAYCVSQAAANVLTKGTDPSLSPLALSAFRMAVGSGVLGAALVATARGRSAIAGVRPVIVRATVATLGGAYAGIFLATFALRTVSAGVATTLIATTPLFALVASRVVDGVAPSPRTIAGAALAVAGVALLVIGP